MYLAMLMFDYLLKPSKYLSDSKQFTQIVDLVIMVICLYKYSSPFKEEAG